uniref:Uncharacterized protein n=1 Tax=Anguilla anguilla TaxID=7936 RepID=A0A0E9RMX7_ANGAN
MLMSATLCSNIPDPVEVIMLYLEHERASLYNWNNVP